MEGDNAEQIDMKVSDLKETLSEWKPLILGCSRLMLWDKPLEAAILVALPTLFFTIVYFLDAGLLTILSLGGLAFVFLDLGLPHLISHLNLAKNANDADDDVIFERFCNRLVTLTVYFNGLCTSLKKFRSEKPPVFYVIVSIFLASMAWIGACVNGICLAYIVTLGLVLYPGICKHRVVENGLVQALDAVKALIAKIKGSATAAPSTPSKKKK